MKKLVVAVVLITLTNHVINSQTTVGFENLTLDPESFYNGSADHSGNIGSTETFYFSDALATFYVDYTLETGYDYWSGFSYANQTDLETASYTNYSAYSTTGGGAAGSSNFVIAYIFGGMQMSFEQPVDLTSMEITNSVWAYKFMTGEDGSGHAYEADDYFKLTIKGKYEDGTFTDEIDFYLGDFTGGNTSIIDDWTQVDLSGFDAVVGLEFQLSALDAWTPFYFCLDNLVYETVIDVESSKENSFSIFPNPVKNRFKIQNVVNAIIKITDFTGKNVFTDSITSHNNQIDISKLVSGVYSIQIIEENKTEIKRLIKE